MDRGTRGSALALLGVVLLLGTMVVSAGLAPDRVVDSSDETPVTLVGSQGGGVGWHYYGSVYLLDGREIVWKEGSADSYFGVTMLDNGNVLAAFMDSGYERGCAPYAPPCTKTGFRIIDPDAPGGPAVIHEFSFPVRTPKNSEVHDVELLSTGEYLLTDMEYERIFTVRNGTITWQWNASSFYEAPPDPTKRDWLHLNDVDSINATHYLVSIRNANQILLIERGVGVVEVINEDRPGSSDASCLVAGQLYDADGDGDVRCGDPTLIDHQHNPQWLGPGAVLVADSDNDRIVELHVNETTGEWEIAWMLTSAGGIELQWPRDADRLPNGNTLVTDTLNQRIFEVTANGTVVWSYRTDRIPYEADRLPAGEQVGAPRYTGFNGSTAVVGTPDQTVGESIPLLSKAIVGLNAIVPSTPYWFRETQLLLSLVSLGFVGTGLVIRRRG